MRHLTAITFLAFALTGCDEAAPVSPEKLSLSESGAEPDYPCYTVRFAKHAVGAFPFFDVVLTGDIEGTAQAAFDPNTVEVDENSVRSEGTVTYHIIGGSVSELINRTFVTEINAITFLTPNEDGALPVRGRERELHGIRDLHLGGRGTFDPGDGNPPFEVDQRWSGVVCP